MYVASQSVGLSGLHGGLFKKLKKVVKKTSGLAPAGIFKKKKKAKRGAARAVAKSAALPVAAPVMSTAAAAPTQTAVPAAASVPSSVPITSAPILQPSPQFFAPAVAEQGQAAPTVGGVSPKWLAVGGAAALALMFLPRLMKGRA